LVIKRLFFFKIIGKCTTDREQEWYLSNILWYLVSFCKIPSRKFIHLNLSKTIKTEHGHRSQLLINSRYLPSFLVRMVNIMNTLMWELCRHAVTYYSLTKCRMAYHGATNDVKTSLWSLYVYMSLLIYGKECVLIYMDNTWCSIKYNEAKQTGPCIKLNLSWHLIYDDLEMFNLNCNITQILMFRHLCQILQFIYYHCICC